MKTYKHMNNADITVVEFEKSELSKIHFALCQQPRETLSSFYKRQTIKPDVICNGGLFNMADGVTMFEYRTDDKAISTTVKYKVGMGINRATGELEYGNIDEGKFIDFISGYPPLVCNGVRVSTDIAKELDYKARRTALGYNSNKIFLVAVEGRGLTFAGLTNVMLGLHCTHAINLDGGGSTKILVKGESITSENYNRAVDNVICFYRKTTISPIEEPVKKVLYTVQIGAFKSQTNCLALVDRIKRLEDTIGAGYKNAYCKLINGLYKCQVGAFSKKANAQKVVDDLRAKGYNAFIAEK